MKAIQKKAFLYRYIISFLLILIVPMVCLLFYIANLIKSNMQKDLMSADYNNTVYIHNSVDNSIRKFENLALLTMSNSNLKTYFLDQSYFNYYQAVSTLKYIKGTNELLNVLVLYNKSNDLVISNFGTIPKQYFGNKVLSATLDNKIALKDFIETVIQPVYTYGYVNISGIGERRCLLYFYPTTSDFEQSKSIIMMIVDVQNIIDLFDEQYNSVSGSVFILDESNNTVVQYGNANEKILNNYLQYNNRLLNGSEVFLYQNNKYCVSGITSLKTGWKYISIVSFSIANREFTYNMYIFYFVFIILFIISGLGIYISIRLNYNPLLKLKKQIEPIVETKSLNEVETIRTAVNMLINNVDRMSSWMKDIQPAVHNYLIQQMLFGHKTDIDDFKQLSKEICFSFYKSRFMVGIIKLKRADYEVVISDLMKISNDNITVYYLNFPVDDMLLAVFNLEEHDYEKVIAFLNDFVEHINMKNKYDIHISLGRLNELQDVSKSYFEACIGELFKKFGSQNQRVYCFNDIMKSTESPSTGFCPGHIRDFELNILRANIEYIAKFPSIIMQEISTNYLPEYYIDYVIYELIRVVISSLAGDASQEVLLDRIWDYIFARSPISSTNVLEDVISFICNTIIQHIRKNPITKDSTLNEILKYIDENYYKPDFSIQLTASAFNMSPSWLSHYFKQNMYITIAEFVQNKRIKYSQQLILENECSTNEISEQLGYCNVSSFIRAFKKTVGMTPKQYKETFGNSKP
ncbi:MAG TPA: AraC family transcriptional regulator [Clostridiales bacterium]|nr:AraC family transcriptional regulator [Clostridiales bacterium]